jgi:hypothetical protein
MNVSGMKLEHNKNVEYAHSKVQIVCAKCVYMGNVSRHKKTPYGKQNMTHAQM